MLLAATPLVLTGCQDKKSTESSSHVSSSGGIHGGLGRSRGDINTTKSETSSQITTVPETTTQAPVTTTTPQEKIPTRVTEQQLTQMGFNEVAVSSASDLNRVLDKYSITSTNQIAHFLAQCAYEGDWGEGLIEYDNAAKTYLKSQWYWPYYGAGYIQLSTEDNYKQFSIDMNDPLIYNGEGSPEYVAANYAWEASAWWWDGAGMNNRVNQGYTVNQVAGMIISWNKNAPDNGSYKDRNNNYNKILGILE